MKVLLVVPNFYQAIGIMGQNIVRACPEIEFYFFKSHSLNRRRKDFEQLTQHVDVVHWLSNVSRLPVDLAELLRTIDCPTIGTIHHLSPGEMEKVEAASLCDIIHVESAEWLDGIRELSKRPVMLAHQPVDITKYARLNQKPLNRNPYRIGTFGFVDSLDGRKRIDILLESLKILLARNVPFELVVQGPNWDKLLPFFTKEGIQVNNLGFASAKNTWKAYGKIDVYVCSSEIEGGPLTVIEALASHVPVVSTKVGAATELLNIGGGILVEKNNPGQMASAIELLLTDKEEYAKYKANTSEPLMVFSMENIALEYQNLYDTAMKTWESQNRKKCSPKIDSGINPKLQQKAEILYARLTNTAFFNIMPRKSTSVTDKIFSKILYS